MSAEEWRPVPDWPDYEVSSTGRVLSRAPRYKNHDRRPLILTPGFSRGYPCVVLTDRASKRRATKLIHHLVAAAFIGPRPSGLPIRHLDGDPMNNHVGNLAYGTASENMYDQVRHGTHFQARKTRCPQGHPYDEGNTKVSTKGRRKCRTCHNAYMVGYNARTRGTAVPA